MAAVEISTATQATCVRVHQEAADFYAEHQEALGRHGFETLYGPPVDGVDVLFIGYQPGGIGGANAIGDAKTSPWPERSLYASAEWRLATNLRRAFDSSLERSTGLNAIFMRSPNIATYYREVSRKMRDMTAAFCRPRVIELIDAITPKHIVVIGFATLALFDRSPPHVELCSASGRSLIVSGKIGTHNATAILHLSGARMSTEDRQSIGDYCRSMIEARG